MKSEKFFSSSEKSAFFCKENLNFAGIKHREMNVQEQVGRYIEGLRLLPRSGRLLVAVSGGADSVCLLHVLLELGYAAECVHCNFHLRGEESLRDEAFVSELCQRLGVRLHVRHFDTKTYAEEHHVGIEMAARQLRYAAFEDLRKERRLDAVCVGHHREDNIETVLLNLVRGTGLRGLCGIQPRQGHVVRPLLCLSKAQILDYLKERGEAFVTDSTNLVDDVARNRIRLDVLPLLRTINAAADENILTCIENLNEAHALYRRAVDDVCAAALDGPSELDIATILRSPSPMAVLHELLSPLGFNRSQIKDILNSIERTGKTFSSPSHRLVINREQLVIEECTKKPSAIGFSDIQKTIVPYSPELIFERDGRNAYFDADLLANKVLTVRAVKTGDRFRPFGMKGTKLVSDMLTDQKLSRFEKEKQRVLCADDEIIWLIGRRAADCYKVTPDTQRVLWLRTNMNEA